MRIAQLLDLDPSTVGRVLARHQVPLLSPVDPTTEWVLRGRRACAQRYEYDQPGGLVHVDVKKLGKVPDGGGWRSTAWLPACTRPQPCSSSWSSS